MIQPMRVCDSDRALIETLLKGLDRLVPILEAMRDVVATADREEARELAVVLTRLESLVADVCDTVDELSDAAPVEPLALKP